jgi:periplasmic divalent cation tolerance protein
MRHILVYVTTADVEEAERISRSVLELRLAACSNIIAPMRARYWWRGALESATEAVLLFKSREGLFPELRRKIRELHSYETPCIAALPIIDGDPDYLDWIEASCAPLCSR